jgi:hypothetical protein
MENLILTAPVLLAILIWVTPWKGIALWQATRNGHKIWFVVLLVLNTLALLEIIYIFFFAKKKEIKPTV